MMQRTIRIERFRCFESLEVEGLQQVNVIMGANNSGKSALLEAVEFVAGNGSPRRLFEMLSRRGQLIPSPDGEADTLVDLRELVWGRPTVLDADARLFSINDVEVRTHEAAWLVVGKSSEHVLGITSRIALAQSAMREAMNREVADPPNVIRVGSQLTSGAVMRRNWGKVAGNPSEDLVTRLLQTFDKSIQRIVYSPESEPAPGFHGWYLRRHGTATREAISGQGEGLKRVLALGLAFTNAAGGTLLVDEIENGMHYSVMPAVWKFIIQAARDLDVQVFMTSHSRDFIDAFADAAGSSVGFADVAFFRLEAGRSRPVRMSHEVVASLAHTTHEIR